MSSQLFTNISKIYTMRGGVRIKGQLNDPKLLTDAWMLVEHGMILEIGHGVYPSADEIIDLNGQIVVPGFIDAHTHLVHAGNRVHEYAKKIAGISYLDILKQGGGILSTVKATRAASLETLTTQAHQALKEMMRCGVTTMEAKSGYGLDQATEIKQLTVIQTLNESQPVELYATYMPAHALPPEFHNSNDYIQWLIDEAIAQPINQGLTHTMDCFLEQGVFSYDDCDRLLTAAKQLGYEIKLHIDEIFSLGGVDLAVKLKAVSVEHCMVTTSEDALKLAQHRIPCVLLPATSFNLGKPYANALMMKQAGVIMALASDYNPGSSPCSDFIWVMRIASRGLRLLPCEVLSMVTVNAAYVLQQDHIGILAPGKQADFVVLNVESFDQVIAILDANPITRVYKKGKQVC